MNEMNFETSEYCIHNHIRPKLPASHSELPCTKSSIIHNQILQKSRTKHKNQVELSQLRKKLTNWAFFSSNSLQGFLVYRTGTR